MWSSTLPSTYDTSFHLPTALIYVCGSQQYTQSKLVMSGQSHSFEISYSVVEGGHHLFIGIFFSVALHIYSNHFVINS